MLLTLANTITSPSTPPTSEGGGDITPLVWDVVADMKGGAYTIDAGSVAVSSVLDADSPNWGPFDPATDITAGVGLTQNWPIIKHPLVDRFTSGCVMRFTVNYLEAGVFGAAGWQLTDFPGYAVIWDGGIDAIEANGGDPAVYYFDADDGIIGGTGAWDGLVGTHTYVVYASNAQLAASTDGAAIITGDPADNAITDIAFFNQGVFATEKIEIVSLANYLSQGFTAADLPTLSA